MYNGKSIDEDKGSKWQKSEKYVHHQVGES